jgi:hypothetical protein
LSISQNTQNSFNNNDNRVEGGEEVSVAHPLILLSLSFVVLTDEKGMYRQNNFVKNELHSQVNSMIKQQGKEKFGFFPCPKPKNETLTTHNDTILPL